MLPKIKNITFFIVVLIATLSYSQEYFQQEVNYKIDVQLNDITHELSAFETIEYVNNSPDELSFIYFHIWPNAYDNNSTALAKQKLENRHLKLFTIEEQRGFIDSLDFKVNGDLIKWEYDKEHIDICKLYLKEALKPGERIIISTPFHVKLPKGVTSRLGHVKQSYQITQWYPKPAVYDKYGWHQMPYLNMGEFYSEFGSFDVSITLPKNYIVGATGDLQNNKELDWLNELAEKTLKIESFDKQDASFPESFKELKTLRFIQKNIHDFAWFADKRFHVLKGERKLPHSKKKVTTWAMFLNRDAELWKESLEYIGDAVYFYSEKYGNYPYNHCTAVHSSLSAGGGMEYPNITVIGNSQNARSLEMVIMHEVGHNWFYGILGFNEREYTWQDEGINSFSEARYMREKYGKDDVIYHMIGIPENIAKLIGIENIRYKSFHEIMYLLSARTNRDQHASLGANDYTEMNYGTITYMKTARVFDYLLTYLGKEKFDGIMQKFYADWKYKHPYPEDIRQIFEEESGKDLSWLFDDLLKTTKKVDYKICKVKGNSVIIKNKGQVKSPILINGEKNGEIVFSEWFEGFEGKKTLNFSKQYDTDKIMIDAESNMLELYRNNNFYKTSGIFKKTAPLKLQFLGIIENPKNTQINFVPTLGWNNYNKFMLGASFYNAVIPKNKFEYQIMPMYAFGSQDFAGSANIGYTFYPLDSKIQSLKFSVSGKRYAYNNIKNNFHTVKAELGFLLKEKDAKSKVKNRIILNAITASNPEDILFNATATSKQYFNLNLSHKNYRVKHPYTLLLENQLSDNFVKTALTAKYKFHFQRNKTVSFRLFAGTFLSKESYLSSIYHFNLSGTTGINDYLYEETFLGRYESPVNSNFLSSQFIQNEGAFVGYTPFGNTDALAALNITTSIPYLSRKVPLELFANASIFSEDEIVPYLYKLNNFAWEGGVKLSFLNNSVEIYLPVLMSEGLENVNDDMTNKYLERIRFTLKLHNINPFKILEQQLN